MSREISPELRRHLEELEEDVLPAVPTAGHSMGGAIARLSQQFDCVGITMGQAAEAFRQIGEAARRQQERVEGPRLSDIRGHSGLLNPAYQPPQHVNCRSTLKCEEPKTAPCVLAPPNRKITL